MTISNEANLLFGLLALQNAFITREELVAATSTWLLDRNQSIASILKANSKATKEDLELVDLLLARHCARHAGEAAGLAAVAKADCRLARELSRHLAPIDDGQLSQHLSDATGETDSYPTQVGGTAPSKRFEKTRFHKEGGLGQVFVAVDNELDREVALKEIRPQFDGATSRKRFLTEATITGQLEHPGIVPIYGLGLHIDGRPFYAMKFIRGKSLSEAINQFHKTEGTTRQERGYALRRLLSRLVIVCNTIHFAHSRRIVHRDIKPDNIMLGDFGETLVVDWGLAKLLDRPDETSSTVNDDRNDELLVNIRKEYRPEKTRMGSVVGTLGYAAPEQVAGRLDLLGPLSDVYSLGATMYSLLVGRPPYWITPEERQNDDSVAITQRIMRGLITKPREIDTTISQGLEDICLQAMATEPAHRFQTALDLGEAIEHWLADEPISQFRARVKYFGEEFVRTGRGAAAAERYGRELANFALVLSSLDRHEEALAHSRQAIETFTAISPADEMQRFGIQQELVFIRQQEIRSLTSLMRFEECQAAQADFDNRLNQLLASSLTSPDLREEMLNMTLHLGMPREEIESRLVAHAKEDTMHSMASPATAPQSHHAHDHTSITFHASEARNDVCEDTNGKSGEATNNDEDRTVHTLHAKEAFAPSQEAIRSDPSLHEDLFAGVELKIMNKLGEGGVSRVFAAMDVHTMRRVAVKVAKTQQLNPYLRREIQIVSHLQHQNIIPLYASGTTADGCDFYVMPLLDLHRDLSDFCRASSTPLPSRAALTVLHQVCHAVEHAHSLGIIHRDIKPTNILFHQHAAYLMDWSLAIFRPELAFDGVGLRHLEPDAQAAIGGTPVYMAPEQTLGEITLLNATTDVYLLGATLYELLCGTRPQRVGDYGNSVSDILRAIEARTPIKPVESLNARVPEALARICHRAMKFEPSDRFQTVSEFRLALGEWLHQVGHDSETKRD